MNECRIYGISVWDVNLEDTQQLNLVITPEGQPDITVDNLKIAQFIYLLLNNAEIREVIDTIGQKGVLILGRWRLDRNMLYADGESKLAHVECPNGLKEAQILANARRVR